jgi:hypothetical protein
VREALHEHWPPADRPQQRLADAHVVVDEVALVLSALGEQHLAGTRDPHLAPLEFDDLHLGAGHCDEFRNRPVTPASQTAGAGW